MAVVYTTKNPPVWIAPAVHFSHFSPAGKGPGGVRHRWEEWKETQHHQGLFNGYRFAAEGTPPEERLCQSLGSESREENCGAPPSCVVRLGRAGHPGNRLREPRYHPQKLASRKPLASNNLP